MVTDLEGLFGNAKRLLQDNQIYQHFTFLQENKIGFNNTFEP